MRIHVSKIFVCAVSLLTVTALFAGAAAASDLAAHGPDAHPGAPFADQPARDVAPGSDDATEGATATSGCTPHPPILISQAEGPQGFILGYAPTGQPIYRPGSGVSDGRGTASDPYVIENWCFTAEQVPAVSISGTTEHVVIRDSQFTGSSTGIELDQVENVDVEDSTFQGLSRAVYTYQSDNMVFEDNSMMQGNRGLYMVWSDDNVIRDNQFLDHADKAIYFWKYPSNNLIEQNTFENNDDGVYMDWATDENVIRDNTFRNNGFGIAALTDASDNLFESNTFVENGNAIYLYDTLYTIIRGNTITDSSGTGMYTIKAWGAAILDNQVTGSGGDGIMLANGWHTTVRNNTVSQSGYYGLYLPRAMHNTIEENTIANNEERGIDLSDGMDNLFRYNTIRDNGPDLVQRADPGGVILRNAANDNTFTANNVTGNVNGFIVRDSEKVEIHDNNIENSDRDALVASDVTNGVNATDNWWGHDTGPSGGVEDDCNAGTFATGSGGSIATNNAGVCFDPWRSSPNTGAGDPN